jgi:hypothetical protein
VILMFICHKSKRALLVKVYKVIRRRKEAIRTSNEDFEDAVRAIKKSWSLETIEIHDKLRKLYSLTLGIHKGNIRAKKYKST